MKPNDIRKLKIQEALRFLAFICFCLAGIAVVAHCSGCASEGLTPGTYDFVTNSVQRAVTAAQKAAEEYSRREDGENATEEPAAGSGRVAGASSDAAGSSASSTADVSPAPVLDFRYGGFKGGKAVEDPRCRLSSPKITADSIRYKWESGAPSDWARNKTESGNLVIAAAFFWDEDAKKWVGGKFEWTDESRSSRSCQNIYEGYGGWAAAAWKTAKRRAFCVVSADGKYRSNLLED